MPNALATDSPPKEHLTYAAKSGIFHTAIVIKLHPRLCHGGLIRNGEHAHPAPKHAHQLNGYS